MEEFNAPGTPGTEDIEYSDTIPRSKDVVEDVDIPLRGLLKVLKANKALKTPIYKALMKHIPQGRATRMPPSETTIVPEDIDIPFRGVLSVLHAHDAMNPQIIEALIQNNPELRRMVEIQQFMKDRDGNGLFSSIAKALVPVAIEGVSSLIKSKKGKGVGPAVSADKQEAQREIYNKKIQALKKQSQLGKKRTSGRMGLSSTGSTAL